ncbi:hypothetical protein RvY_04043 [Ramazzottius varieornatus]|uniref:Uncharacterized protein n=1 Tax=Ramazzottius varieornatus TaxID=947166 RepID=A0A1D1UQ66_RAMVA|nr:hypothetical protein RvY_04043 [Ramazzottius varieornatus]
MRLTKGNFDSGTLSTGIRFQNFILGDFITLRHDVHDGIHAQEKTVPAVNTAKDTKTTTVKLLSAIEKIAG